MWTRRSFLTTLGPTAAGATWQRQGRTALPDDTPPVMEVIAQVTANDGACGPCALANALTHADGGGRRTFASLEGGTVLEQVETIIARYGKQPSETLGRERTRYSGTDGTTTEDLPFLANDLMRALALSAAGGQWLDVRSGENGRAHLRRVHGLMADALAEGLPAVVEVCSFGANTSIEKGPRWGGL